MTAGSERFDDILRRELHDSVARIEPSPDSLERIRSRMYAPRHARVSLALAGPGLAGQANRLVRRAAGTSGYWLQLAWAAVASRFQPAAAAGRYRWLRPAVAFGTAVFIVAAGSWAVSTLPQVIAPSANNGTQNGHGGSPGGPTALGTGRAHQSQPVLNPTGSGRRSPSGRSSCKPSRSGAPSASHTPSGSPSPSQSPSPSVSPSGSPSGSPSPSPTDTATTTPALSPSSGASLGPQVSLQRGFHPMHGTNGLPKRASRHKPRPSPSGSGSRCG